MVKFKEYSKRCICILSVCVCFLVTVLCPSDLFLANESVINGEVSTFTKTFDFTDSLYSIDSNIAEIPSSDIKHPSGSLLTYWYYLYEYSSLFVTSKDVYAYRIVATVTNVSVSSRDLQTFNLVYGGAEDFGLVEDMNVGLTMLSNGSADYWYVNDYAVQPFYVAALALYGGTNATPAVIDYSGNLIFTVVPYTMDDMLDEIYAELLNLVDGQDDLYDELVKIYESSVSMDEKLNNMRGFLMSISQAQPVLHNDLLRIETALSAIQETLDDMNKELDKQTSWLSKIWGQLELILGLTGDNGVEGAPDQDDSDMVDLGQKEDDLLGSSSPGDASDDLKVELDAEASSFIWDTINDFVTVNPTVFGVFISVLSLGILALILGR